MATTNPIEKDQEKLRNAIQHLDEYKKALDDSLSVLQDLDLPEVERDLRAESRKTSLNVKDALTGLVSGIAAKAPGTKDADKVLEKVGEIKEKIGNILKHLDEESKKEVKIPTPEERAAREAATREAAAPEKPKTMEEYLDEILEDNVFIVPEARPELIKLSQDAEGRKRLEELFRKMAEGTKAEIDHQHSKKVKKRFKKKVIERFTAAKELLKDPEKGVGYTERLPLEGIYDKLIEKLEAIEIKT
jgi:hypothetical protein